MQEIGSWTKKERDDGAMSAKEHFTPLEQFPPVPRYYRIGTGPKGRGLFAIQDIPPTTLLHVAPCIAVSKEEYEQHMRHTVLEHYLFNDAGGKKMLALGDGSLFNHSKHPNVDYRIDAELLCIRYSSGYQGIQRGNELCISYGAKLWFDDVDGESHSSSSEEAADIADIPGFLGRMKL
jgi:hypothetical protein